MKHNNIIIMSVLALVISLTGCGNINKLSAEDGHSSAEAISNRPCKNAMPGSPQTVRHCSF